MSAESDSYSFAPIGRARTPFVEKNDAPRQAASAADVTSTIELFPGRGFEDALVGLETFSHIWILFAFDRSTGWRPKVLPPRSRGEKIGVFATRSPHRPNPIGMSVVELLGVSGLALSIRGTDLLDGTPIFDIKPYIAYADSVDAASHGWLGSDPEPAWPVSWAPLADEQARFLESAGLAIRVEIESRLALGPQPHAYRRIRVDNGKSRLAWKDWRVYFRVEGRAIVVESLATGYRKQQLSPGGEAPELHRSFAARFQP